MAQRRPSLPDMPRAAATRTGSVRSLSPATALEHRQVAETQATEPAVTPSASVAVKRLGSSQVLMPDRKITPSHELMIRVREVFHREGYDQLTMVEIAKHCDFTRRALYFYFSSKEEALRAIVAYFNELAIRQGLEAGDAIRRTGGSAIDILTETLDIRYGETRRNVSRSPHLLELNGEVFRRCHDLIVESALVFHRELEAFIRRLAADGILTLAPDISPTDLTRLLADGARGVNQTLPPLAAEEFGPRYRAMTRAILFGCVARAAAPQVAAPDSAPRRSRREA